MRIHLIAALAALSTAMPALAQSAGATRPTPPDSTFAAMQARGKIAMGVDQYTSTHQFDSMKDGGRIELQRDVDDSVGVAAIRAHIRDIAAAFRTGDFSTPAFVHLQTVPGTQVMTSLRSRISYEVKDLPRGAELRIRTADPAAVAAIHEFMAFQRGEHHASGHHPD
jgi:hypothetical protein